MPIADADLVGRPSSPDIPRELPFPTVTKSHILNCSYHSWYPRYRSLTPKARLIRLTPPFLSYLRADGIRLPPEPSPPSNNNDYDNSSSSSEDEDDEPAEDPSLAWPDIHHKITATIAEMNGSVIPKLNWSAPKDATWIAATNSMECRTPNDIYLLLKSSDFVTHDLEQVLDDCESDDDDDTNSLNSTSSPSTSEDLTPPQYQTLRLSKIPYHLILRKTVPNFNPSLEFRCFVRSRHLLCICQRDLNHFSFLSALVSSLRASIQEFFDRNLQRSFPDENFVFDVYVPPPHGRVWLIDVNPWAPRTDPLLFSWLEILRMRGGEQGVTGLEGESGVLRLSLRPAGVANGENGQHQNGLNGHDGPDHPVYEATAFDAESEEDEEQAVDDDLDTVFTPEFRLVNRDDPEAYSFNTPQFSAHKLPKDVVDAGVDGTAGLREFMGTWREIMSRQEREDREDHEAANAEETNEDLA